MSRFRGSGSHQECSIDLLWSFSHQAIWTLLRLYHAHNELFCRICHILPRCMVFFFVITIEFYVNTPSIVCGRSRCFKEREIANAYLRKLGPTH